MPPPAQAKYHQRNSPYCTQGVNPAAACIPAIVRYTAFWYASILDEPTAHWVEFRSPKPVAVDTAVPSGNAAAYPVGGFTSSSEHEVTTSRLREAHCP